MWGAIISAVGSIATSAIGAGLSAKAGKDATEAMKQGYTNSKNWYNRLYNQDYVNRSEVQGLLTQVRNQLADRYKRARATNIVAGGTDESLAMMQRADNQAIADATASIASNASTYKDKIAQAMEGQEVAYGKDLASAYQQKAKNISDALGQTNWDAIAKLDA